MEIKKYIYLFVPLLILAFFQISCATVAYEKDIPGAGAGGNFRDPKPHRIVSILNGLIITDSTIEGLNPTIAGQEDVVKNIHVEKDFFEDFISVVTLGIVNVMEVDFNNPSSGISTPFKADLVPEVNEKNTFQKNMGYPGKEAWLFLGIWPLDGGTEINSGRKYPPSGIYSKEYIEKKMLEDSDSTGWEWLLADDPSAESVTVGAQGNSFVFEDRSFQDFHVQRRWITWQPDPIQSALETLKFLIFNPVTSGALVYAFRNDPKFLPLAAPGFGAVGPYEIQWHTTTPNPDFEAPTPPPTPAPTTLKKNKRRDH